MTDPTHPLVADFAQQYPFALDEYQVRGCEALAAGRGVLVAAPTGAGKTVVGEFAVHLAVEHLRKVFYTTPIKALSNQKYHDLVERYGHDQVGLLTGDLSVNAEAQIVVMTTEVLRNMIYAESTTLGNLGYVVLDEVHYLADKFRGAVWEEVILGLAPSVQLVALSATVSNVEDFGDWLRTVRGDLDIVVSERRPVPLFQHVLVGRRFHDLFQGVAPTAQEVPTDAQPRVNQELLRVAKAESGRVRDDSRRPRGRGGRGMPRHGRGSGAFGGAAHPRFAGKPTSRADVAVVLDRAKYLPAIYFIFSRVGCDAAVGQVMGSGVVLTSPTEARLLGEIADRHAGALAPEDLEALGYEDFREALTCGVAAHHAGQVPAFKAIVEEGFQSGALKLVFATETLALGINMPARTVVLEKLTKYNGESHVDITPGEFTQLTGRAGRRGIDVEGHAVVLWQPGMDPRAVAGLASRRTYPLRSSFRPTYNMAVNLMGTLGRERARALLSESFSQYLTDKTVVQSSRRRRRGRTEIDQLRQDAADSRGDLDEYARLREGPPPEEGSKGTVTLAEQFDRVTAVLSELGYLDGDELTAAGRMLCRIYNELDLVAAECVRRDVFAGLDAPELAAVLSTMVYESRPGRGGQRTPRMPDGPSERAQSELRAVWRELGTLERRHSIDRAREPDIGFAESAWRWASGYELGRALRSSGTSAGDFVRATRQVIDLAGQLVQAVGPGDLRRTCRDAVDAMRRGVVAADMTED